MNTGFDARDFERGTKRVAKSFRRVLRKSIDISQIETTEHFDRAFRADVNAVIGHLSRGYEAVNAIGLNRSSENPPYVEQSFFLFHEALNLTFVALRTIRGGSVLASDGVLRQAVELVCVAYHIVSDKSGEALRRFIQEELSGPKSISVAKKIYQPIGRLYGTLSNSAVHASLEHVQHSISGDMQSGEPGRIRLGASFDPKHPSKFKLGMIRIERAAVALVAVIEAGLIDYVEQPRLWRKTTSGLEWIGDREIERRLALAEREQKAIEEPYAVVYSWADPEDREEVQRLLGATEGPAISDVTRLRELARTNPSSFVVRYLLGAALQDAGDFVGAASEFEEAWALRHHGYDIWSRLEGIYTSWDDSHLESFYRRSIERDREDYVAAHNLGMLYGRLGQEEDALECFKRAHELKPERFMAAFNTANSLLRLGQYQQAIDSYSHAAEREPHNPAPWHSAGVAHVRMGDLSGAYRAFRRAVLLDPGYLASWANLAGVCRELGFRPRALACAKRAQQLAPRDDRMTRLVDECHTALRRQ